MTRIRHLLSLILVAAVIAGQWAGHLHALSHAKHDLALALQLGKFGKSREAPAPLDHSADRCLAFHAVDCAIDTPPLPLLESPVASAYISIPRLPLWPAERTSYLARAPPVPHALS